MSYTYLQDAGEESSAASFSDIPASVLSRLNLIAEKFSCNASETTSYQSFQSGMTSEPLTENLGMEKSILSRVDFPAKTSAKPTGHQVNELESRENEADCGRKCYEWFAKLSQDGCSWKIPQCSLFEDSEQSLETWPKAGIMLGGECFLLPKSVYVIDEKECSSLPTPVKSDAFRMKLKAQTFMNIYDRRKLTRIPGDGTLGTVLPTFHQKRPSPESVEMMMSFPIGWTGLERLEMPKFQAWLNSHEKL